MRNFVSKILAKATPARLFPRPSESGAPAQGRLDANRLSPLLPAGLATAVFLGTAPSLAMGQFDTLRDYLDGQTLTVASNLSFEHRFLMFFRQYTGADGELLYELYNRFPIGAYLLNKAALAPFGDSPSAQIAAVRLLSAALFSAAAMFAYLGLRRLTNRPWIAAAATLLAFSSYHALFYREMISSEVNGVFGMMLTFHGMTVFAQEGRFRQLLIKAFAAILIDWTVMALLLPFTAFGLASALFRAIREIPSPRLADKARAAFAAFVSSRHLWLGTAALLFCALVMGFNLANEYVALKGEVPLLDLPSARSMLAKAIIGEGLPGYTRPAWLPLIDLQLERVGGVSIPYLILPALGHDGYGAGAREWGFWVGAAVSAAGLVSLAFTRYRVVTASLLLGGWIWALAVRGGAAVPAHEYEALYYIGVPLVVFASVLTAISRRIRWSAIGAATAAAALIVFGISLLQFVRFGYGEDPSQTAVNSDLKAIGKITQGASVCVGPMKPYWGSLHAINYYLSGSVINSGSNPCPTGAAAADPFIIEPARAENGALLTPGNKMAFLYAARSLSEPPHETAIRELSSRDAIMQSTYDIHLEDGQLIYAKEPCAPSDRDGPFLLRVRPADNAELSATASPVGFQDFVFLFNARGDRFNDACLARVALPDYPIERVRASQFDGDDEIWSAFFVFHDAVYRSASAEAALSEPAARNHFDIHLQGDSLLFLKDPCAPSDAEARFLLHVRPADDADPPQGRKEYGFDNLTFGFDERGAVFDGKCAAIADLPAYPVERVRFGQFDDAGVLWSETFVFDDAPYRSAFTEAALSEPVARNHFDLYLQDNRLFFIREPCAPSDADARFFLHVHPVDGGDLPRERRQHGFDNLDFGFDERGLRFDGKCAAIADLPAYPIERIRAGQIDGDGEVWEASLALRSPQ